MGWRFTGVGWRSALSLIQLAEQVDVAWPDRDRVPDGTVASSSHTSQNPTSDHEPSKPPVGIVAAIDIAHNTGPGGADMGTVAEAIRQSKDQRVKYVIFDRRMFSSYPVTTPTFYAAYEWRPYGGSNPHTSHMHVSVSPLEALYDSQDPWSIGVEGDDSMLTVGAAGQFVRLHQVAINLMLGHRLPAEPPINVDSKFGTETEAAVKKLQAWGGVTADGTIGGTLSGILCSYLTPVIHDAIATDAELDVAIAAALEQIGTGVAPHSHEGTVTVR